MSSEISPYKNIVSEEFRFKNQQAILDRKNELELKEIESKHNDDIQKLNENYTQYIDNLRNAYDVKISEEAEVLEDRLHKIRLLNEARVEVETKSGEEELSKLKKAQQSRVEEYRKNSELEIETLHKQMKEASEALHEQARKTAKKEREGKI